MAPKLKGYNIGETIGRGSCAKVKKCVHVATGETVAIKIISFKFPPINHGALERAKEKARREIFVAKNLKHPNILGCYEGRMRRKKAYIVMKLMEGGTLENHLVTRGRLTEGEARKYFRQLIHGIDYCHKHFLFHRDLKPTNLLLDQTKEHLKIADFGVCNYPTADLTLTTRCGTAYFQAPEIDRGNYSGPAVDIYSCGITLYNLLCGCLPTYKFEDGEVRVSFPESVVISENAANLIERMIEFLPENRITIPAIKDHCWFQDGDSMFLVDPNHVNGIDNNVLLDTVNIMGCGREDLIQSLIEGAHTEETVTYKLLKRKMRDIED